MATQDPVNDTIAKAAYEQLTAAAQQDPPRLAPSTLPLKTVAMTPVDLSQYVFSGLQIVSSGTASAPTWATPTVTNDRLEDDSPLLAMRPSEMSPDQLQRVYAHWKALATDPDETAEHAYAQAQLEFLRPYLDAE